MIEKIVSLENISLPEFLGVENKNIDSLAAAFPKSRIVSRGNQIVLKGSTSEIVQIDDILTALIQHYHKYGRVTEENVKSYISREEEIPFRRLPTEIRPKGSLFMAQKDRRSNQKQSTSKDWWMKSKQMILFSRWALQGRAKRTFLLPWQCRR